MYRVVILLLVVIPALEIWILYSLGRLIGGWETFLLIVLTGVLGAYLAKKEAKKVWSYAKLELAERKLPGASIVDGICIFAGGLLLLTPGLITDTLGFLLVLPFTRKFFRAAVLVLLQKWLMSGKIVFFRRF